MREREFTITIVGSHVARYPEQWTDDIMRTYAKRITRKTRFRELKNIEYFHPNTRYDSPYMIHLLVTTGKNVKMNPKERVEQIVEMLRIERVTQAL